MRRLLTFACVAAPLFVACSSSDHEAVTALDDFETLMLDLRIDRYEEGTRLMRLEISDGVPTVGMGGPCPILEDNFVASVAGANLVILDRGGFLGEFDNLNECRPAKLELDDYPELDGAILMLKDSGTASCQLGDALLPRFATSPTNWVLMAGQTATFMWSPPDDVMTRDITLTLAGKTAAATPGSAPGEITIAVPATPGEYSLDVTVETKLASEETGDCGGVTNTRTENFRFVHPVTIQ
jgi:hypothetical protein